MAQTVTFNGVVYSIPDVGDDAWGENLTDYFLAIAGGALQKTGGAFTLTADVNFGATYGVVSAYFKSRSSNIAGAGVLRLANAESIAWRNAANSANLALSVNSSDQLTFAGNPIFPSSALTASRAVVTDGSGLLSASSVTATELGYVSGVTSSIQTQLDGKQASGSYITALTGDATASGPGSAAVTLATVNSNVGSFGSSTAIPSFTVNGKGLITAASTNAVIAPAGTLTGTTLASNVVTSSLTSVGTLGTGVWNATAIGAAYGGTGQTSLTANNVILGNGTSAVQFVAPSTSGNVLTSNGTTWVSSTPASAPSAGYELANLSITASVAANALTVALKDASGSDPSAGSPVKIGFRSSTATSGVYNQRAVTGALSMTVSSGSTLGHANSTTTYVNVYAIDNAGTVELAVSTAPFPDNSIQTTTAEGGAGAADSNRVLYSTTARTSVPIRLIGRLTVNQTTAGTWASAPTVINTAPLWPYGIGFRAHTASTTFNNASNTVVFSNKSADTLNMYSTSTGTATVPLTGWWTIGVIVTTNSVNIGTATSTFKASINVNGSEVGGPGVGSNVGATGTWARQLSSTIREYLTAGDTVNVTLFNNDTSTALNGGGKGNNEFSMTFEGSN